MKAAAPTLSPTPTLWNFENFSKNIAMGVLLSLFKYGLHHPI